MFCGKKLRVAKAGKLTLMVIGIRASNNWMRTKILNGVPCCSKKMKFTFAILPPAKGVDGTYKGCCVTSLRSVEEERYCPPRMCSWRRCRFEAAT